MREYTKKISIMLILTMLVSGFAPASYAEAAAAPYLAYQTTEDGAAVNKLATATEKEAYRVEKLLMSPGEQVDLCFINAGKWKNSKWTSSDTNVATINGKGLITAKNPGVSEITLTYKKKLTNKKVTVKTKVYVGEEAWGVGVGTHSQLSFIDSYQLKVGTDIDLNVYGIPELDSWNYGVEWKSSNKSIAEMLGNTLHARKAGTAEITVKIKNGATGKVIEKKIMVSITNPIDESIDNWDNEYYKLYGENYKRLFATDALLISNEIESDMLDEAFRICNDGLKKIGISAALELTDISSSASSVYDSLFVGRNRVTEKGRLEAIQYLIQELTDDGISEQYVKNVNKALKKIKTMFDNMKDTKDFEEAVDEIKNAGLDLKESEVDSIIKYFKKDAIGDTKKILSEGITISEYMISTICLYEADNKFLDELQKCSVPGEALYDDIALLKKEREKDPATFFKQYYISDVVGRVVSKVITKIIGKEVTAVFDGVDMLVSMCADMASVPSLDAITKAVYLRGYIFELSAGISRLQKEIKDNFDSYTNKELKEKIEQYELMYNTFLAMVEPVCNAAGELEDGWNQELGKDALIPLNGYDYNRHVAEAMNFFYSIYSIDKEEEKVKEIEFNVQDKMDLLLSKLGVKDGKTVYFTVNQKACKNKRYSGHGCTNCNVGDIVKTTWFKNIFGTLNTSLFPSHNVDANRRDHAGQSCFGFACFAQYYVYANGATDKVTAQEVARVTYNKADLQSSVKPGDVIRVNGHSMLVYAVEENGLTVIDSNWNMGNQLNCVVQKHLVPYEKSWCSGYTVYVNRVGDIKVETTKSGIADPANGQVGYLDLSKVGWSAYNVGTDVEMGADKAYTIYQGSKLKILNTYINSKGNKVHYVYAESLEMYCYVASKVVSLEGKPTVTPKPTTMPKPTATPKPTTTPSPTPSVTTAPAKTYGYLDLSTLGWSAYNVGTDVEMNASKAYTVYPGSRFEILGKYTNSKGNQVYHVYSESLGMKCYVSSRVVALGEAPKKTYGVLDLSAKGWTAYNAGMDVELNADRAYTIYDGAQLEVLGTYTNSKGNQICHVYSPDLKMNCYIAAKFVKILR